MERYKVFLSPKAHRDLDKIYAYIADSLLEPDTALALVERIEDGILSLDTLPLGVVNVHTEPISTNIITNILSKIVSQ